MKTWGYLQPNENFGNLHRAEKKKLSSLRTFFHFHSALVTLESQVYVVVEQFGAENISLVSRRLVF